MSDGGALVLVGFMGAGKTAAARDLAAVRGLRAVDVDRLIEDRAGVTISELFARDGEPSFRALEEEVVCELLDRVGQGDVVSMSGGAVGSVRVREALRSHLAVWLDVDPQVAWRRAGGGKRPLARDRVAFEALHEARQSLYREVADATIPASARGAMPRAYDAASSSVRRRPGPSCCGRRRTRPSTRSGSEPGCSARRSGRCRLRPHGGSA